MEDSKICELIGKIDKYTEKIKELRTELKDELENTPVYKSVYEATAVKNDGIVVSEKDAATHAYKVTLKNYKQRMV